MELKVNKNATLLTQKRMSQDFGLMFHSSSPSISIVLDDNWAYDRGRTVGEWMNNTMVRVGSPIMNQGMKNL